MCGLAFWLRFRGATWHSEIFGEGSEEEGLRDLERRGPDWSAEELVELPSLKAQLLLRSSVLHLRGELTKQPTAVGDGRLLFNGELYEGPLLELRQNDTQWLAERLEDSISWHFMAFHGISWHFSFKILLRLT